jgi:DNA-binding MarR family transcriptional regulator
MKNASPFPVAGHAPSNGSAPDPARSAARNDVNAMPHPEELLALSKRISASRIGRRNFFAADLFAEPAWEMLLALYRADAAGHRMSVSNLCYASEAPGTTALRWIDKLEELGLVSRRKNPLDARMVFIELDAAARTQIEDYLLDTWVSLYVAKNNPKRS